MKSSWMIFAWHLLVFGIATLPLATSYAAADNPKIPFEKYQLENGLEVILHQDTKVPLVAIDVWYHVGAGDEVPGKSGFAHLFEHMLFQGSENVGEDRHFSILKNLGSTMVNGTTNFDRTNYFEVLPSHQLEAGLWLESDRMGYFLPMLTRESLDNQIEVVRNEKRQRTDNVPYGISDQTLFQMLYPKGHPYRGVVIGDHKDLSNSSLEDVKDFYRKWYTPANATLVLAGDFEIPEAKRLVKKWFGTLPKASKMPHQMLDTPKVVRDRKLVVDKFAKLRRLAFAWHTPGKFEPGSAELKILSQALTSNTGRLYKALVHETQLAQSVSAYQMSNQMSGAFFLQVMLKSDADQSKVEAIIEKELSLVMNGPLKKAEINRAVIAIESRFVWSLESLMARAEIMQSYNHYVGTPDYISQDLDLYRSATAEKIQKTATKYLGKSKRVEVLTVPIPKLKVTQKPGKGDKS